LDHDDITSMALRLGESEESVTRGLEATFATMLAEMAGKIDDPQRLHEIFELMRSAADCALTPNNISSLASAGVTSSPLFDSGRRLLPLLFGGSQKAIAESIERSSELTSGSGSRLMTVAAPIIISYVANLVREDGSGETGFTNFLQRLDFSGKTANAAKPVRPIGPDKQHTAPRQSNSVRSWLFLAILVLAVLIVILSFTRRGDASRANTSRSAIADTGDRARAAFLGLGEFVDRRLPGDIWVSVPANGVEMRLLSIVQDTQRTGGSEIWLDFDRLSFDSGSAIPRPESEEQLQNIAAILKAYPNVRMKIGSFIGGTGDARANRRLAENRAEGVKRELAILGVSKDRVEAEGYANLHAHARNSTPDPGSENSRISMRVLGH
jgi:flagellar motor protein MotB